MRWTTTSRRVRRLAVLALLAASTASADVRLPRLLGDGVILQRDTAATVWGWADEGEVIAVRLDGKEVAETVANDGRWTATLPETEAGGPHVLEFVGDNLVVVDDVWFGDVWIASGQSNMQLPMERVKEQYPDDIAEADLPLVRYFTVPREYDFDAPREDVDAGDWQAVTPESVMELSAVGFFFARALHRRYDVPVGIVSSNFGGSAAESWMSEEALAAYPNYLEIARKYRDKDYLQGLIDADAAAESAWRDAVDRADTGLGDSPPWSDSEVDDSKWRTMPVPGFWAEATTGPRNGAAWYRRTFEMPSEADGRPAKLMLGRIVDADTAWINGVEVGNTTYQYPPRRYEVGPGVLKAGTNTIAVRVVNSGGFGGFVDDKPYWIRVGDRTVDLSGDWRFRMGAEADAAPPPQFVNYKQPLGFYNAMLAPLTPMRIKGAIWYQGETNTDRPAEYEHLFRAMIRDWRRHFRQGDFPFLFVQLANFLAPVKEPAESGWAGTREAQRKALAEPNTAMAVAIDVGEWNDIHPLDKRTVADRLALAARHVAYGEDVEYSGPLLRSAHAAGARVIVEFDHVGDGLVVRGDTLHEFAIAGADGHYGWAQARVDGDRVVAWRDGVDTPRAIRYSWADNPDHANLYNKNGLPASPFEAHVVSGDFVETFAGDESGRGATSPRGWTMMTGDGEAAITLSQDDGIAHVDVDATRDEKNIWWALIRHAVTPAVDVVELARPDRELRVEARVRTSVAPRRINLHLNHSRTTDFHSHLMEYDIAYAGKWRIVSMTTHGFDARPGDEVYVQMALMDWGRQRYGLDVDYVAVTVVDPATAGNDVGEPLPYRPKAGHPRSFDRALPAGNSIDIRPDDPGERFIVVHNDCDCPPVVDVSDSGTALLHWGFDSPHDAEPAGWGMLELTTWKVFRPDVSRNDYNVVRVAEVLGDEISPQLMVDVVPAARQGGKTRIPISPPVLRRLLSGRSTGLALVAQGEIAAEFVAADAADAGDRPTLYLNVDGDT